MILPAPMPIVNDSAVGNYVLGQGRQNPRRSLTPRPSHATELVNMGAR